MSGGDPGDPPAAARHHSPASSDSPWVQTGNIHAGGNVSFTLTQERATAHRMVDKALAKISLFLHRDLVRSLSGRNGTLEPNRDFMVLLENAAAIRSSYPYLPEDQKRILEQIIQSLETDLNRVLSIIRDAVSKGMKGRAEGQVVKQLDIAISASIGQFESLARLYHTMQKF